MEMDEQIFRSFKGRLSTSEEAALAEWRGASEENERRYQAVVSILAATDRKHAELDTSPPDVGILVASAGRARWRLGAPEPARWRRWLPRVAAVIALPLLGVGVTKLLSSRGNVVFQPVQVTTARGETTTVHTSDGTLIHLAPESRLDFPQGLGVREVTLTGRAYFSVAKKHGEPFFVHSPSGEVKVLGTRFDLSAQQADLRLIVVEGRVALTASGREVQVAGGEMTRVVDGSQPSVVRVSDLSDVLDWEDGFLAFRDTPVGEVARELEERYGLEIQIGDSALAHETVTAWFSNRSADEVLTVICSILNAHCLVRGKTATISR